MSDPSRVQVGEEELAEKPVAVPSAEEERDRLFEQAHKYWQENIRVLLSLLAVWFLVSFGAGVLFVDVLNKVNFPFSECPLGFWFAQQGAIYGFVVIVFAYVRLMNKIDSRMGVED